MKKKKYNIEEEIQKTLDSVDGIQRVKGNPFLYTRLQERMNSNRRSNTTNKSFLSPMWQFALVAFLLVANVYVLLQSNYSTIQNTTAIEDVATEYEIAPSEDDTEFAYYND